MQTDYHIHTKLCKHSNLTIEQVVKEYLLRNFKEIGISDHIPYPNELGKQDKARMNFKQLDNYLAKIEQVKKDYQTKIKILAGFESEYFPSETKYYQKLLARSDVDYLILGVHSADDLTFANNFNFNCNNATQLARYWKTFSQGMKSGYFIYPAHPDFYMKSYPEWDKHCQKVAENICDLALELDFPLGFNINGFWKKPRQIGNALRHKYPVKQFWEVVRAKGVKIILESDVHDSKQLYDKDIDYKVKNLLSKWNLQHLVIPHLDFKNYWKKHLKVK